MTVFSLPFTSFVFLLELGSSSSSRSIDYADDDDNSVQENEDRIIQFSPRANSV